MVAQGCRGCCSGVSIGVLLTKAVGVCLSSVCSAADAGWVCILLHIKNLSMVFFFNKMIECRIYWHFKNCCWIFLLEIKKKKKLANRSQCHCAGHRQKYIAFKVKGVNLIDSLNDCLYHFVVLVVICEESTDTASAPGMYERVAHRRSRFWRISLGYVVQLLLITCVITLSLIGLVLILGRCLNVWRCRRAALIALPVKCRSYAN